MKKRFDMNADAGESFGLWQIGADAELFPHITSANIACGAHAGDPTVMRKTIELAALHQVAIGAHPGYPDLQGFGRRAMTIDPEEIHDMVVTQIGALQAMAHIFGMRLQHMKLHGALYNTAAQNAAIAQAVCRAALKLDAELIVVTLAGSVMAKISQDMGLRTAEELFIDRGYAEDGTLLPRSHPHAIVSDAVEIDHRAELLTTSGVIQTEGGLLLPRHCVTLCVHSDTPNAAAIAARAKQAFRLAGAEICPMAEILAYR